MECSVGKFVVFFALAKVVTPIYLQYDVSIVTFIAHIFTLFLSLFFQEKNSDQPNMHSQDMGNSASSSNSSSNKQRGHEDQINFQASLSPILRSYQKRFARTEVHPNGLKNINLDILKNVKNSTLLQASVTDIINHKEGSALAQYFRSLSALDFRNRDPENTSESFESGDRIVI